MCLELSGRTLSRWLTSHKCLVGSDLEERIHSGRLSPQDVCHIGTNFAFLFYNSCLFMFNYLDQLKMNEIEIKMPKSSLICITILLF